MDFRRRQHSNRDEYPVYEHISDLVNATMCKKNDDADFHDKSCIDRKCKECGVHMLKLSSEELSVEDTSDDVKWMCYEYVTVQLKDTERKKAEPRKQKYQNRA